jgi:hypothetical protein
MTKKELENHIKLYKETQNMVLDLDREFGVCV